MGIGNSGNGEPGTEAPTRSLRKRAVSSGFYLINLWWAADYERLISEAHHQLELDPANKGVAITLALAYAWRGRQSEARSLLAGIACSGYCVAPAVAYARLGMRDEVERMLAQIFAARRTRYVDPSQIARVYAALGQKDTA